MTDAEIGKLAIAKHRARRAVEAWMEDQAKLGNLVQSSASPHWLAYENAQIELARALIATEQST